jgi:Tol biopolymer transport system component
MKALITSVALLGGLFGCGHSDGPTATYTPPVVPSLEAVPYAVLGSGKVAFERIGGNGMYSSIYVIDATAASSTHALDDSLIWGSALSPDGLRLAYTAYSDNTTLYDVFVRNIDGTGVQHATHFPQQEGPPAWSPDGAKIVVAAGVGGSLVHDVYSQSPVASPGDPTQLTHFAVGPGGTLDCPVIIDNQDPVAISTRGELAFACYFGEIDVLSSSGTPSASYLPSRNDQRHWPNVFSPSWSPDGMRLAFVETTSDSATNYSEIAFSVKIMDANGTNVSTVTTRAGSNGHVLGGWFGPNDLSLCWMPDGSRLVFTVPESELIGHIWVVRPDGTGLAQLTSAPGAWDRSVSCSR